MANDPKVQDQLEEAANEQSLQQCNGNPEVEYADGADGEDLDHFEERDDEAESDTTLSTGICSCISKSQWIY